MVGVPGTNSVGNGWCFGHEFCREWLVFRARILLGMVGVPGTNSVGNGFLQSDQLILFEFVGVNIFMFELVGGPQDLIFVWVFVGV